MKSLSFQYVFKAIFSVTLAATATLLLSSCSIKADVTDDKETKKLLVLKVDTTTSTLEINEGSTLALVITQSMQRSSKTPVSMQVTSTRGDEAVVFGPNTSVTTEIDSGQTSVLTSLTSIHDARYTGDRSFRVTLQSPDTEIKSVPFEFIIVIKDLEAPPIISATSASQNVTENAGPAVIPLSMSLASSLPMTVAYSFTNGSASNSDYASTSGTVTFAPGEVTKNINVAITDDSSIEAAESFTLQLGTITGGATLDATKATHVVTIDDNDYSDPTASFSLASQSVNETSGLKAPWPSSLASWKARRKIRIDNGSITETLTNFPVLVKLDSNRIDYAKTRNAGEDLRFTDENGTLLKYEIEKWNEAGTSTAWVLLPTVTASTNAKYFWMYYDNAAATSASSAPDVWGGFHQAVYHLNENAVDATGSNSATAVSMTYMDTDVNRGGAFNGTSSYVQLPSGFSNFTAGLTLEAWVRPTSTANYSRLFDLGYGVSNGDIILGRTGVSTSLFYNAAGCNVNIANVLTVNTWQHIAVTHAAGAVKIYKNGAEVGTGACALPPIATRTSNFIGKSNWTGDALWAGGMDEARIHSTPRSAQWLKAKYLSETDTYLFINAEESLTSATRTMTVNLSGPALQTVQLSYAITGTALAPADHTLVDGTLTIAAGDSSGVISFQPVMDGVTEGNETFVVTLTSATNAVLGAQSTHTVTIVDNINAAPVAATDTLNALPNATTATLPVLLNDSDPNGDSFIIASSTNPSRGVLEVTATSIRYTPPANFSGTDSFTYTIADEFGLTSTATVNVTIRSPFNWTGSSGDAKYNTASNWYGGAAPGSSDVAYFSDSFCSTNCNMTINAAMNVKGLSLSSNYTGTITQNAALTVGTDGFLQAGGTFNGGAFNVAMSGPTRVTGGSYRASSAITYVNNNDYEVASAATFDANSGTLNGAFRLNLPANTVLNNFYGDIGSNHLTTANSVIIAGTFDIDGSYGDGGCLEWGTFNLQGDIVLRRAGFRKSNHYCGSSGQFRINGTGDQTITNVSGTASMMKTVVDKASGTLFMPATLDVRYRFEVAQGTLSGNTAVHFYGTDTWCGNTSRLGFGNMSLSSLVIDQWCEVLQIVGNLQVDGNVSYYGHTEYGRQLSGTIKVAGNFEVGDRGFEGGTIELNGSGNQTLNRTGANSATETPNYVINNSGAASGFGVTLLTSYQLRPGRNLTVTQGRFNFLDSSITMGVPGTVNINSGAEINLNGGTLNYGSLTGTGTLNP